MIEGAPLGVREAVDDELLQEACGVVGVIAPNGDVPVAQLTFSALSSLQHRGEGAAGILNGLKDMAGFRFLGTKDTGLVADAFPDGGQTIDLMTPRAHLSIGHVRWPTSSSDGDPFHEAQPFIGESAQPLAVAQNGHIEGMVALAEQYGITQCLNDGDALTRVLSYLALPENSGSVLDAIHELTPKLDGGYSLVVAEQGRLHGIRDPWGTHPLWLGRFATGAVMIASEQPALRESGRLVEELEIGRGEVVSVGMNGEIESSLIQREAQGGLCALEGAYFARPDGTLDGRSVYKSRIEMGRILAREQPAKADLVIAVPDSGIQAAMGYAEESGTPYGIGFFKNPYSTRSFIQADPATRQKMVLNKLRPNRELLRGMRVVVVDDSIVRGTSTQTMGQILRGAGATEVHFRISTAPIVDPCFSGVAISRPQTLFARRHLTHQERVEKLGADSLGYLSPEGLARALGKEVGSLCMACMTGEYLFDVPAPVPAGRKLLPLTVVQSAAVRR
jgi:amidophosphoribosyltransferase